MSYRVVWHMIFWNGSERTDRDVRDLRKWDSRDMAQIAALIEKWPDHSLYCSGTECRWHSTGCMPPTFSVEEVE